jgi:hypothetical protein
MNEREYVRWTEKSDGRKSCRKKRRELRDEVWWRREAEIVALAEV